MKTAIIMACTAAAMIILFTIPLGVTAPQSYDRVQEDHTRHESPAVYKEDGLDSYLSRLAWSYECTGKCRAAVVEGVDFRIVDSNGKFSYGCFQFQEETWLRMAKAHGIDPWENGGIYNCDQQWKVARAMFLEDREKAAQHWYTSIYIRGLGLPNIE